MCEVVFFSDCLSFPTPLKSPINFIKILGISRYQICLVFFSPQVSSLDHFWLSVRTFFTQDCLADSTGFTIFVPSRCRLNTLQFFKVRTSPTWQRKVNNKGINVTILQWHSVLKWLWSDVCSLSFLKLDNAIFERRNKTLSFWWIKHWIHSLKNIQLLVPAQWGFALFGDWC